MPARLHVVCATALPDSTNEKATNYDGRRPQAEARGPRWDIVPRGLSPRWGTGDQVVQAGGFTLSEARQSGGRVVSPRCLAEASRRHYDAAGRHQHAPVRRICAPPSLAATLLSDSDMRNLLVVLSIAAGLSLDVLGVTWIARAQDRAEIATGARLFTDHGCYGCHRIGAFGTPIGPELTRIGAKYSREDLVRWLSDPASQKPNAHMPKLDLSRADVTALAAFLSTQR